MKARRILWWLSPIILALILAIGLFLYLQGIRHKFFRNAAAEIRELLGTDGSLSIEEMGVLLKDRDEVFGGGEDWYADRILTMANGDWMVYVADNRTHDRVAGDFFVGYGSDRVWYYTTWHFCLEMRMLHLEPQPGSLEESLRKWDLVAFEPRKRQWFKNTTGYWYDQEDQAFDSKKPGETQVE